jgi:hypothetical protein
MAEAAGLALGVIGVTALFSTCVESFDIIVSARECSQEYEEQSALVGFLHSPFMLRDFTNSGSFCAARSSALTI